MDTSTPLVWITKDYESIEAQFKEHTFYIHVLGEKQRLEFIGEENTLKRIVEQPRFVLHDKDKPDRIVCVDLCYLPKLNGIYWVGVYIEKDRRPRDVATVIATRKIPKTGGIIYDSTKAST